MGFVATPLGPIDVGGALSSSMRITGYVSSINGKQGAVELDLSGGGTESVGGISPNEFGDVPLFKSPGGTIQVATPDQYGNGSSGTDWHSEINAVLAAGKILVGKYGKTYPTSGRHTVPEGAFVGGYGGAAKGTNLGSTTFQLTASGAGFDFIDGGHTVQDVMIDGGTVATQHVHFGSSDPTHVGAQPTVRGLAIKGGAAGGSALWIDGTQNGRVHGLNIINPGGKGILYNNHSGGWSFEGFEVTGCGDLALDIDNAGNVAFRDGIFERDALTNGPAVRIEESVFYPDVLLDHVTVASGGTFVAGTSLGTGLALSASADTITKTAHGLFAGQAVTLANIVTATGVTAATPYWVLNPTANTFQLTATQYGSTPVDITADGTADVTKFVRYLLEHRGTGAVELRSCSWAGIATEVAVLASGADVGAGAHAPLVAMTGVHTVTHTILAGNTTPGQAGGMVALIDGDSLGVVFGPEHQVRGQAVPIGPLPIHTSNLPTNNIGRFPPTSMTVNRTTATSRLFGGYVNGDSAMRVEMLADGTLKLGPGNTAADVVLTRNAAASAFLTGSLTGSATLGAPGWRYTRLDHTASADGTITLDASATDLHHVFMAGHNVTLALTGGSVGQMLYVYVQQNATPATLTLPLAAGGVLWTGSDAGKPALTTATGWLSFMLECVSAGVWIERDRGGTNVSPQTVPLFSLQAADTTAVNNSTTLVNSALALTLEASAVYTWEAYLLTDASAAADFKSAFNWPSGATGWMNGLGAATSGTTYTESAPLTTSGATMAFGGAGVGTKLLIIVNGLITTSSAGTLQHQFAQNTADATNTILRAGSYLSAKRRS